MLERVYLSSIVGDVIRQEVIDAAKRLSFQIDGLRAASLSLMCDCYSAVVAPETKRSQEEIFDEYHLTKRDQLVNLWKENKEEISSRYGVTNVAENVLVFLSLMSMRSKNADIGSFGESPEIGSDLFNDEPEFPVGDAVDDLQSFMGGKSTAECAIILQKFGVKANLQATLSNATKAIVGKKSVFTRDNDRGKQRRIKSGGDISRLRRSELIRPDINIRIAKDEHLIDQKFDRIEGSLYVMLVDVSGSMGDVIHQRSEVRRYEIAAGILMETMRAVAEGTAEMLFCPFAGSLQAIEHIKSKADCSRFMNDFGYEKFQYGSTSIGRSIEQLIATDLFKDLRRRFREVSFNIITDGQDNISSGWSISELLNKQDIGMNVIFCEAPSSHGRNTALNSLAKNVNRNRVFYLDIKDKEPFLSE